MYDLNWTEANTSIVGWVPHLNTITNGLLGIGLLLVIMIGCFIAFKKWDTVLAAVATGFIGFVFAAFFVWWGILNWAFIFIPILLVVISVFIEIFGS